MEGLILGIALIGNAIALAIICRDFNKLKKRFEDEFGEEDHEE